MNKTKMTAACTARFGMAALVAAVISAATMPMTAYAEAVTDTNDVTAVVVGWQRAQEALGEQLTAAPASVREYSGLGGTGTYYVVSLEGGGYVVTSGDTSLEPVLAYSKGGTWVDDVKRNPLLAMLPIDVAGMTAELGSANSSTAESGGGKRLAAGASSSSATASAKASKWAKLKAAASSSGSRRLAAGSQASVSDLRVGKLLTSEWGQDGASFMRSQSYGPPNAGSHAVYDASDEFR